MVVCMFQTIFYLYLLNLINAHVETLHFESGCLKDSNIIQLHLRCSLYEHIKIIRVIYGYSKQRSIHQCQFSIYDCIQEGASRDILSCHGKQTCIINLTKKEILSTTVTTKGVPVCSDFNYVQVNFGCIPDANDICDSWKDVGAIVHLSHTRSRDKQFNECQCKVRSSLSNGQVLLQAKEINRQFENSEESRSSKSSNTDCKKTTYLEIATDRSERKCMDNLPSNGNALFGSGSHNFTLTYIRNDPFSELFFFFELKASPVKKDHHVQIVCNWARRTTTTTIRTTLPMARRRKLTTISMLRGGRLSRLDLIRHPLVSENEVDNVENDQETNESTHDADDNSMMNTKEEEEKEKEEEENTIESLNKRKLSTKKILLELVTTTPILSFPSEDDNDEWSRISSITDIESPASSEHLFSSDNQTLLSSAEALLTPVDQTSRQKITTKKFLLILLFTIFTTLFLFTLYCLKVKQPTFIQRLKLHFNVAFLFCCEASKLLFSAPSHSSPSMSRTSSGTITHHHHHSSPLPIVDYQSSAYYMNGTANNCPTIQSIYDYDSYGEKSIYSIYTDNNISEGSEYTTRYDRYQSGDTC